MEYLIGMDGGGTATKICVADRDGSLLSRHTAGPLNINGQSHERFQETMAEIKTWLEHSGFLPQDCIGIGIGAAGSSNPLTQKLLEKSFESGGYRAKVHTYSDGETALAAAFPACRGIVLIAGTGSLCLGRNETGEIFRAGGFGHLIDDGGSAYAMAVGALAAAVRSEDGRGKPTALRRLVMERLGLESLEGLAGYLYAPSRSKKDIAALAVLVTEAADGGDEAAMEIEQRSAGELNLMTDAVMAKLPEEKNIALTGSVLMKNQRIRQMVTEHILTRRKDACVLAAAADAAEGAVRLLKNRI